MPHDEITVRNVPIAGGEFWQTALAIMHHGEFAGRTRLALSVGRRPEMILAEGAALADARLRTCKERSGGCRE